MITSILAAPFQALGYLYVLWIFYLAVMNLMRARDAGTLTKPAYYLGMPVLYVGLALDVFLNLTVFTIVLQELPKSGEWTVSQRLGRHLASTGYRQAIAVWFAVNLLDPFDPSGKHLKS